MDPTIKKGIERLARDMKTYSQRVAELSDNFEIYNNTEEAKNNDRHGQDSTSKTEGVRTTTTLED